MMIGIYSQSSSAQQQKRFNKNFDKLELSEDQKVALEALQEEKKIAYEALPSDASKEDKMDLRKSFKDKMASILTAEQLAILKENRNRPSKRRGKYLVI